MLWILLLSCWSYPSLVASMTWYLPVSKTVLSTMFGEQVDLMGADNVTYTPDWMRNVANNGVNDATGGSESIDSIDIGLIQSPVNSVDRDRESLDEVERIEPKQWSSKSDILPTRSTVFFTTKTSLISRSPQPTTLAQRYPTAPPPTVAVEEVFCDFGPNPAMPLCEWQNGNGILDWTAGTGMDTNWLGGPSADATSGSMDGG